MAKLCIITSADGLYPAMQSADYDFYLVYISDIELNMIL